jgi:hypothetical protein
MLGGCCNENPLLQDVELMPQHQDFGFKPSSRLEAVAQNADEKEGNCEHPAIMFRFASDRESNGWSFRNRQSFGTRKKFVTSER